MSVRAKFKLQRVETHQYGWPNADGSMQHTEQKTLVFTAVSDGSPENQAFWKATPSGELKMQVTNEAALEQFEAGREYYLDFTPAKT
jgi:hypothetical protein